MGTIISSLNGCSFSSGTAVTSVVSTPPIAASIGSCVPGSGSQLTLSLLGGSYTATNFIATNASPAYQWAGSGAASGHVPTLNTNTNSVSGITGEVMEVGDASISTPMITLNDTGDVGILRDLSIGRNAIVNGTMQAANTIVSGTSQTNNQIVSGTSQTNLLDVTGAASIISSGTPYAFPFVGEATSGVAHLEHKIASVTLSGIASQCFSGPTFNVAYIAAPETFYAPRNDPGVALTIRDNGTTVSQWNFCIRETPQGSNPFVPGPVDINVFALGE